MSQLFNYTVITGIGVIILEAITLLIKTESIERLLLDEKKKLLLDIARIIMLAFGISFILYRFLDNGSIKEPIVRYVITFIASVLFSVEIYYLGTWTLRDTGFGNNFFIEDERYGKLYLIKSSNNKFILLADKPRTKESKFMVYEDGSFIVGKKVYAESRKTAFTSETTDVPLTFGTST